ncbi:vWA domain-containing protein [Bacillus rubiinfantis]|uniref:vWA domain-containing protein n=1 Tax=Bacillus rubiinfantis TaxID=1499680 RepID=UPI0005A85095|nr:BatA and WFA domain-containing protein [Bacillus rubiinfantis]
MSFANPIFFSLSLFIAFFVLLYFFRKQYDSVLTPSNLLWQEAMNEWKASPWLQKLQRNVLFWLQFAILLFMMFALVKPLWFSEEVAGEHLIWVIDTSASMSAVNKKNTLMEESKQEMKKLLQQLDGQKVTIIMAAEKPVIAVSNESSRELIEQAVEQLHVTYEHENIAKAVRLAESLAQKEGTVIHIFSDSVKKTDVVRQRKDVSYSIHNTGGINDNISLQSFGVAAKGRKISGLAVVKNQGQSKEKSTFTVKSEETQLFTKDIVLKPGEQTVVMVPNLPEQRFYQAIITARDQYQVDNESTAVLTSIDPPVYTYGEVNPFIVRGLKTIGVNPIQLEKNNNADIAKNALIIVEDVPIDKLPQRPLIYINTVNKHGKSIEVKQPYKHKDTPLLKYVDIDKTYIKTAAAPVAGDWENLVMSGHSPLIQTGMINGQQAILLNFSINDSDWPLHPGFPIFLYNCYQWLSSQTSFLGYFQPGEEKYLQMEQVQGNLEIYNNDGQHVTSLQLNKENFTAPYIPGMYQAIAGEQMFHFSVMLDDREKEPAKGAAPSFTIETKNKSNGMTVRQHDSLWHWFALMALALLMAEWEVYRRGIRV